MFIFNITNTDTDTFQDLKPVTINLNNLPSGKAGPRHLLLASVAAAVVLREPDQSVQEEHQLFGHYQMLKVDPFADV